MMNFCAIYKVSAIYISCLVIREYLFFVLPAYHVLAFQNGRKEVPYVFGLYIIVEGRFLKGSFLFYKKLLHSCGECVRINSKIMNLWWLRPLLY